MSGGQVMGVSAPESRKYPHENQECDDNEAGEYAPLESTCFPEDLTVAHRVKPEEVNPIGNYSTASQSDDCNESKKEKCPAATLPWRIRV